MNTIQNISKQKTQCYHCGDACVSQKIVIDSKQFCCNGCKSVYEILNANDLCTYYNLNEHPGLNNKINYREGKFDFLDKPDVITKLIQFTNKRQTQVTFYLPQIHCSSCLWLLENMFTLNKGIINTKVNFTKKEIFIIYDNEKTTLKKVVETLTKIGYEPHLSLNEVSTNAIQKIDRSRWYKIGVAGFCFGNIMMMSFADYFAKAGTLEPKIGLFFKIISLSLSLPIIFYSATEFFHSAWSALKSKYLNIDFPIALALVITFVRSIYEIINNTGNGYLDSMSGIVFFMLIGRWLQNKTYQTISFDRDYKSFFPIALNVLKDGKVISTEIEKVKKNDIVLIHNNEIIPLDALLSKGNANIDYSFVSGESQPVQVNIGEIIYAGGKQLDGNIELLVVKEVSQSYLTNLWNNPIFHKSIKPTQNIYDIIGKYFTYAVLAIGLIAGIYWHMHGATKLMWNALTTVLIVACPCALLLSQSFTNGNILRLFGLQKFYLRSAEIIDRLAKINHIVFDKTGTITQVQNNTVKYVGQVLTPQKRIYVASLIKQSMHPASVAIFNYLNENNIITIEHFKEIKGAGLEAWIDDHYIKIGSSSFIGNKFNSNIKGTNVIIKIDDVVVGAFVISNKYRFGVTQLILQLKNKYSLSLLSGDNDAELKNIQNLIGIESEIHFNQNPQQKLNYIQQLQEKYNLQVMMVGDGLNDAGAIKQSNVGIAVAESGNNFTPACDGVIDGNSLPKLSGFLKFAKSGKTIILISFIVSSLYNIIGLYFAVQGILSPLIAAVLMPCSSITIILLTYGLTEIMNKKYLQNT